MTALKRKIKNIFVKTNSLSILDKINYGYSSARCMLSNIKFKRQNKGFVLPPDYYLYETYQLDYKRYKEDGKLAATEIHEWTTKYLQEQLTILEWGCGVARIVRHIPNLIGKRDRVFGTDINREMIDWNSTNITNVNFSKIDYSPPTHFDGNQFNLVFGLSVFTHIECSLQANWMAEIHRIMSDNGVFLFSTHGKIYEARLGAKEKSRLDIQGAVTIDYKEKGHRMMSTHNRYENFKTIVQEYFEILEYYDGARYPDKVGGQDLWIVRKRRAV
jgi:SAM-dependent methyltransferase